MRLRWPPPQPSPAGGRGGRMRLPTGRSLRCPVLTPSPACGGGLGWGQGGRGARSTPGPTRFLPSSRRPRHHLGGAVVAHGHVGGRLQRAVVAARTVDEAYPDLAPGGHPRIRAFARADRQLALRLVPRQRDARRLAALVAVAAAAVLLP